VDSDVGGSRGVACTPPYREVRRQRGRPRKFVELKCLWNDTLRKEKDQSAHIRLFNAVLYCGWRSRDSKDGKSLGWWMLNTRRFECQCLRDRIYALLGLVNEARRGSIKVDCRTEPSRGCSGNLIRKVVLEAASHLF
jgi:hypothetical protein